MAMSILKELEIGRLLAYWKKQLADAPFALNLPTDRPRPATPTYQTGHQSLVLSPSLFKSLERLSQQADVTLFMTLLAAFQTLLHRYTGRDDIVLGSPIAGRGQIETQELIGCLVNTLVLRTNLAGNPTFWQLLERVRETALGAYAHQDLPFEKLVEILQPDRDTSRSPLFQVLFALQNTPGEELVLPGLKVSRVETEREMVKFDLSLYMWEDGAGLTGYFEYNTDLFDAATITRMAGHFQTLLAGLVTHPDQPVASSPLLTEAEHQQILLDWNKTQLDYPQPESLVQLVETQVERSPEATALIYAGQTLSYSELNRRANQVAHYLQTLGVGPEVLVGICAERSLEMVIGLLGILKAGGAYVPLDPAYPKERLAFMVNDAQVAVLLTQEPLLNQLPSVETQLVCLDRDWPLMAHQPQENPISQTTADNLAYVIYTSGSTGQPKGVQIPHAALLNFLASMRQQPGLSSDDTLLAVTTLSFDIAGLELFLPLSVGARVVLVSRDVAADGLQLATHLAHSGATVMQATPATWRLLLETGWSGHKHLKILCGGEALPRELADQLLDRVASVWNMYGPTETTIWSAAYPVEPEDDFVPIAGPIANTQLYLLDPHLQLVPVGVPAELVIGGAGLARGYLNRPDLTAEKFIPDPFGPTTDGRPPTAESSTFSGQPSAVSGRLYKTGDLARYLPDGRIEFLGRIDHQVKIRGFRIELGEIEAILNQHPAVQTAVVLAQGAQQRLVAYLLTHSGQAPSTRELRSYLAERLPDYMLPSVFIPLEALPLTPNGKVDRRALPMPDTTQPRVEGYTSPRNPTEAAIAAIWAEVLGLEQVGVHDNFFELGGHSLLATQVISRLRNTFQLELPLRTLFEAPTVAGLAERLEMVRIHSSLSAIAPVSRDRPLPLSFAQQRLWFLDQLEPDSPVYNLPSAVRLRGAFDGEALQQALETIVARHEALRTTFIATEGDPLQVINNHPSVPLSVIDLSALPECDREAEMLRLATEEARRPFNLTADLMLRATVLRLSLEEHVLLLTLHHIASDAWSTDVLFRELSALYVAFSTETPAPLPELPIQYADFALWQREWLQGEVLATQLAYWKQQLDGELPTLALPLDGPRPRVQTFRSGREILKVSPDLSQRLKALSQREEATLFMILLAAFKLLLFRYTGQDDIIVGSPIAGRTRAEIENLIGCFLNTLALRTDLSGDIDFRELLKRVREVALGAYTNQDIPFEYLLAELCPERDLNRTPLFQIFFNLINSDMTQIELPELAVEFLSSPNMGSKFDLTLYVAVQSEELIFSLVYNTDLFTQARMAEMLAQYEGLLEQIVAAPDRLLSSYSLVTARSRHLLPDPKQVLPEPVYELLPQTFMSWANRNPQHPAISQDNQVWTYEELAEASQALTQLLLSQGLERGEVVAVCGSRSFGLIAGIISVFLSGGVLLTLDQNLPTYRHQVMLQTAKAKRLLYVGARRPEDEWMEESLDLIWVEPGTGRPTNLDQGTALASMPLPELGPDDAAYIFYTSGTTGVPKGILGCHKGLAHFLSWQRQTFEVGPQDRSAQLTGLSFDVVLRDIFLPLTSGATLCLPAKDTSLEPAQILPWLERERISLLHTVPSLVQSWLIDVPAAVSLRQLRWVFSAGEPLTETLICQWRKAFPEAGRIVNIYGPTETTLAKCFYLVPTEDVLPGVQPVGSTLPETQALVLTKNRQLCGISEPGEIVIRTPFRSLGYINAPEENEQRFVRNPFQADPRDLLYYTGDRGRYRPDGLLEILGRLDHQVKIRGVRIEPGEISAVLSQHPTVHQAAVVAWEDGSGEKSLVAYIVPIPEESPTISDLSRFLRQRLPDYMVPSAFVLLESLPLTPNGKVDRRALPAPETLRPELEETFVPPRNPTEAMVAAIWAEILGLEQVGIHDNFFELGGHSLKATQVVSRIYRAFQVELPLRHLFGAPTIAALSQEIEQLKNDKSRPETPGIKPVLRQAYGMKRPSTGDLANQWKPKRKIS